MTRCHVPVSAAHTSQQDIPQTPTVLEKLSLKLQSKERGLTTGAAERWLCRRAVTVVTSVPRNQPGHAVCRKHLGLPTDSC